MILRCKSRSAPHSTKVLAPAIVSQKEGTDITCDKGYCTRNLVIKDREFTVLQHCVCQGFDQTGWKGVLRGKMESRFLGRILPAYQTVMHIIVPWRLIIDDFVFTAFSHANSPKMIGTYRIPALLLGLPALLDPAMVDSR